MTRVSILAWGLLIVGLLLSGAACSRRQEAHASASRPSATAAQPMGERLAPAQCGKIARLHEVDGIYLAGQPAPDDFEEAKKCGIKTVINLRHEDEIDFDEEAVVTALGMTYVHLPWNSVGELTDAVFDRGRELLATSPRPLMLHCNSANRVGPIWIAYRVLDGGASFHDALLEAKTIGLKTPDLAEKARDYVTRRQPAK